MGNGQEWLCQCPVQIVEPTDDEKATTKATWTFDRSYAHDSMALEVAGFAGFFFIIFVVFIVTPVGCVARGEYGARTLCGLP